MNRRERRKQTDEPTVSGKWTIIGTIIAVVINVVTVGINLYQTEQTRRINHLHVSPEIICTIRQSSLSEEDDPTHAPELFLRNNGPIKVVSVIASCKVFAVDTNTLRVAACVRLQDYMRDYMFVQPQLDVGESKAKSILGVSPFAIFVVDISYYRENDMKKFSQKVIWSCESGQFYGYQQLKTRKDYTALVADFEKAMLGEELSDSKIELYQGINHGLAVRAISDLPSSFFLAIPKQEAIRDAK